MFTGIGVFTMLVVEALRESKFMTHFQSLAATESRAAHDPRIACAECGELHYQNSASRFCVRCWRVQTLMLARANAIMRS